MFLKKLPFCGVDFSMFYSMFIKWEKWCSACFTTKKERFFYCCCFLFFSWHRTLTHNITGSLCEAEHLWGPFQCSNETCSFYRICSFGWVESTQPFEPERQHAVRLCLKKSITSRADSEKRREREEKLFIIITNLQTEN